MSSAARHRMNLALTYLDTRVNSLEEHIWNVGGYVDKIEAALAVGVGLHPETLETIHLMAAAKMLRKTAAKLDDLREKLLENHNVNP
jgi:hypothetical protein